MKKSFCLALFYTSTVFCQELPEGIGPFKLGQLTIKQFDSIAKVQNLRLIDCTGAKCVYSNLAKPKVYIKVSPNTNNFSDNLYPAYYLDNVISYKVRNLEINNKYTIESADLVFVDNVLSFFYFSNPTNYLSTDFETKYGLGTLSKIEKNEYCYINDERFPYTRKNYYRTYSNGYLEINRVISDGRDDNCKQKTSLYYIAEDKNAMQKIEKANDTKKELFEKMDNEKKKEHLRDL